MSGRMVAHGTASEVTVSAPITWVWSIDNEGLATSVEAFETRAEALRSAGLPE